MYILKKYVPQSYAAAIYDLSTSISVWCFLFFLPFGFKYTQYVWQKDLRVAYFLRHDPLSWPFLFVAILCLFHFLLAMHQVVLEGVPQSMQTIWSSLSKRELAETKGRERKEPSKLLETNAETCRNEGRNEDWLKSVLQNLVRPHLFIFLSFALLFLFSFLLC